MAISGQNVCEVSDLKDQKVLKLIFRELGPNVHWFERFLVFFMGSSVDRSCLSVIIVSCDRVLTDHV